MTLADPPATRRALRRQASEQSATESLFAPLGATGLDQPAAAPETSAPEIPEPELSAPETPSEPPRTASTSTAPTGTALAWVDVQKVALGRSAPADLSAAASPLVTVEPDLLSDVRRRPSPRAVVAPLLVIGGLTAAYAATTLLWPLTAVTPTITAAQVQPASAPLAAPAWPAQGSAAVSVAGMPGALASTDEPGRIASITKVVTALLVLDRMPLAPGEQGPEYSFTWRDSSAYWQYRARAESALDVPVGGTLTQYQLLEGMLIGSANNYADRLALDLWPTDAVFANAAADWLDEHGVDGVTVVDPTGIEKGNTASPAALLTLAQRALQNPVIAEIVAKKSVELPGAGVVENTNDLLADAGVVGLKTGFLPPSYNLLSAKEITVGDTPVRMFASVLGQKSEKARADATRALYAQLESELQLIPSVTAGTVVGSVQTAWGEDVPIVTDADASVVLWNGASGVVASSFSLDDHRDEGDVVGAFTVTGPLDSETVEARLAADVEGPSAWWRLTHPLELFGLAG